MGRTSARLGATAVNGKPDAGVVGGGRRDCYWRYGEFDPFSLLSPTQLPRDQEIGVDSRVLAFVHCRNCTHSAAGLRSSACLARSKNGNERTAC